MSADCLCNFLEIRVDLHLVTQVLSGFVARPPTPALPSSIFGAIVLYIGAIAVWHRFLN